MSKSYLTETAKVILNHRSIRMYKEERIPDEAMAIILNAAQMAPSSVNGQSRSVVEVTDGVIKDEIIEIAKKQVWIKPASHFFILCMDFRRAVAAAEKEGKVNLMVNQTEALMIGAMDAGLAMANAIAVAESMGYGACPIGAIRNNPRRVAELLDLPEYVYPLNGLVIGVKDEDSATKPRFPETTFHHVGKYHTALVDEQVTSYDASMAAYMSERSAGDSERNWSATTATAFSQIKHPDITAVLKEQGFKLL